MPGMHNLDWVRNSRLLQTGVELWDLPHMLAALNFADKETRYT